MIFKCTECGGERCPYCLGTGKRLFRIGEYVVWDNLEGSRLPSGILVTWVKYLGSVYRVVAISRVNTAHCDRYEVGIDVPISTPWTDLQRVTLHDANLRLATSQEIEDHELDQKRRSRRATKDDEKKD